MLGDLIILYFFPGYFTATTAISLGVTLLNRWPQYAARKQSHYFLEFCYQVVYLFMIYGAVGGQRLPDAWFATLTALCCGPVLFGGLVLNDNCLHDKESHASWVLHVLPAFAMVAERFGGREYDPEAAYPMTVYFIWMLCYYPYTVWYATTYPEERTAHGYWRKRIERATGIAMPTALLLALQTAFTLVTVRAHAAVADTPKVTAAVITYLCLKDLPAAVTKSWNKVKAERSQSKCNK